MLHLAVLSGVPALRPFRGDPQEETYIEFIYYQMHSGRAEFEEVTEVEEDSEPVQVEAKAMELKDVGLLSEQNNKALMKSPPKEVERIVNVKMREESPSPPSLQEKAIYEEGRLINEYARTLDRIIERYGRISYPDLPRERYIEGSVVIHLRVARDGSLRSVAARKDAYSGCPEFKAAAIDSVKRASAHFPPLPEGIRRDEILFTLPVSFSLKR